MQELDNRVVARCEFFEPFGLVGLHAVVLGKPALPRRFSDLQVPAHLSQLLAGPEEFVALGELAAIDLSDDR
jgi:hypothetical protein